MNRLRLHGMRLNEMKTLSRDFSLREKLLLLFLCVILLALAYYQFVDKPVRAALEQAEIDRQNLELELLTVQTKINSLTRMQQEIDEIEAGGKVSVMNSYNNSKEEIRLLNDILAPTVDDSISLADVTRDGDQIRREVSISFVTKNYEEAEKVLLDLYHSDNRCLISDISMSTRSGYIGINIWDGYYADNWDGYMNVTATATFYETMVGGVPDAGLPAAAGK